MTEYCDLCELPMSTCVHGNPPASDPPYLKVGPTITAKSDGRCVDCDGHIAADVDQITHTEDGWVHTRHVAPSNQFEGFEF